MTVISLCCLEWHEVFLFSYKHFHFEKWNDRTWFRLRFLRKQTQTWWMQIQGNKWKDTENVEEVHLLWASGKNADPCCTLLNRVCVRCTPLACWVWDPDYSYDSHASCRTFPNKVETQKIRKRRPESHNWSKNIKYFYLLQYYCTHWSRGNVLKANEKWSPPPRDNKKTQLKK